MSAHEHLSPEQLDPARKHLHELWGAGADKLVGQAVTVPTPWPSAGRSKVHRDYDPEIVKTLLERAPEGLEDVDPRSLSASQPGITAAGVRHYASGVYEQTGELYADHGNAGNIYPVVYQRSRSGTDAVESIILSGHHRAAAALVSGRPLRALVARGGWGPPRTQQ